MNARELKEFKEEISDGVLNELYERTELRDNFYVVDNIEVRYLDGRSSGLDSLFKITGLMVKGNQIMPFSFIEEDGTFEEFLEKFKDYYYIADATFDIRDELKELSITTNLRGLKGCITIYREFNKVYELLDIHSNSIEYQKMKHLLHRGSER